MPARFLLMNWFDIYLTLKGPVPYIYGPTSAANHSFEPHQSQACPALPKQLARTWAAALSHRGQTQAAIQSRSQWTAVLSGAVSRVSRLSTAVSSNWAEMHKL